MTSRALLGEVVWGGTEKTHRSSRASGKYGPGIPIQYEAIVAQERFDAFQQALALRAHGTNRQAHTYPLSGLLVCYCGESYGGVWRQDRDLRQYRCAATKWTAVGEAQCRARRLDAHWVEDVVWTAVTDLLREPDRLLGCVEDYLGLRSHQVRAERDEVSEIEANVRNLERALARALTSSYLDAEPKAHDEAVSQIRAELGLARGQRNLLEDWTAESEEESLKMRNV